MSAWPIQRDQRQRAALLDDYRLAVAHSGPPGEGRPGFVIWEALNRRRAFPRSLPRASPVPNGVRCLVDPSAGRPRRKSWCEPPGWRAAVFGTHLVANWRFRPPLQAGAATLARQRLLVFRAHHTPVPSVLFERGTNMSRRSDTNSFAAGSAQSCVGWCGRGRARPRRTRFRGLGDTLDHVRQLCLLDIMVARPRYLHSAPQAGAGQRHILAHARARRARQVPAATNMREQAILRLGMAKRVFSGHAMGAGQRKCNLSPHP